MTTLINFTAIPNGLLLLPADRPGSLMPVLYKPWSVPPTVWPSDYLVGGHNKANQAQLWLGQSDGLRSYTFPDGDVLLSMVSLDECHVLVTVLQTQTGMLVLGTILIGQSFIEQLEWTQQKTLRKLLEPWLGQVAPLCPNPHTMVSAVGQILAIELRGRVGSEQNESTDGDDNHDNPVIVEFVVTDQTCVQMIWDGASLTTHAKLIYYPRLPLSVPIGLRSLIPAGAHASTTRVDGSVINLDGHAVVSLRCLPGYVAPSVIPSAYTHHTAGQITTTFRTGYDGTGRVVHSPYRPGQPCNFSAPGAIVIIVEEDPRRKSSAARPTGASGTKYDRGRSGLTPGETTRTSTYPEQPQREEKTDQHGRNNYAPAPNDAERATTVGGFTSSAAAAAAPPAALANDKETYCTTRGDHKPDPDLVSSASRAPPTSNRKTNSVGAQKDRSDQGSGASPSPGSTNKQGKKWPGSRWRK